MNIKVKQRDITDCGAACLASVASHYKLEMPVARIRQIAGTDTKGTNVLGMVKAAEQLGFSAKGVKGNQDSLAKIPLPTIAHVIVEREKMQLHHYVAKAITGITIRSNKLKLMNMKKKVFFLAFIALFFTLSASAQLFWKVSANGLSKPSYLFGTHHLIEKELIVGFDKVLAVIPQTDVVVGEMDMSNLLGMQLKMLKVCMMKDTTMHDLLSAEDYALVDAQMKEVVGMGLDKLGKMKPAMLSALYEVKLYMKQNNTKKEPEAVDIVFQKAGKKAKKKIIGLETIDQQLDILFNTMSLKSQAESLVRAVKDKDKSLDVLKQLNEAYLRGDLKKISDLSNGEEQMTPQEKQTFIVNRNNNWIAQLKILMPKQSCFVAVGCLHLVDEVGLIQQLRSAGYTVEAVVIQ